MYQGVQQDLGMSKASWKFGDQAWFWIAAPLSHSLPIHLSQTLACKKPAGSLVREFQAL